MEYNKEQFVEEVGIYFEGAGLTRIAGRIVGWLLICEPPLQQQSDLTRVLSASKSSISVALKELTTLYLVELVTLPGDRRTYYRASEDMWTRSMRARMHQISELKRLSERGLALLDDAPASARRRLQIMHDMNAFMETEFPKLLDAWEAIKHAKGYDT